MALNHAAIDTGPAAAWFTIEDLEDLVHRCSVDGSVNKAFARITRTALAFRTHGYEGIHSSTGRANSRRQLCHRPRPPKTGQPSDGLSETDGQDQMPFMPRPAKPKGIAPLRLGKPAGQRLYSPRLRG